MKPWYQSKTIWFNFILTFLEIIALAQNMHIGGEHAAVYLTFIHGIGNVILRIWFTDTKVSFK